ncbi:MAG: protein of unknown function (DUF456) [halophilic archaeon J07HX64]|jgi:Protein of unknown function (DUF456).|nr:MAG: protein of unknown function (DUF456) [halophilic archaeon J07HX64]
MTPTTAVTVAAFGLLVAAVVVSRLTRLPGELLSLAGVSLYWWGTGYTEPGRLTLVFLIALPALVLAGRAFDRFISARVGEVSTVTATVGGFVGFVGFVFLGTSGLVTGTTVTVFVLEYVRRRDAKQSLVVAFAVVFGTFAADLIRVLMTLLVLLVMITVAL